MPHKAGSLFAVLVVTGILVACGHSGSGPSLTPPAPTEFTQPRRVTILGYTGDAMEPCLSPDGLVLFFNNRNDPAVDTNLHFADRVDPLTFQYRGEVAGANSTSLDAVASMDASGLVYFISTRSYATTLSTVYRGAWSAGALTNLELVGGIPATAAGQVIFDACISLDGNLLWFAEGDYRTGTLTTANLVLARKSAAGFARSADSATLLQQVNLAGGTQYAPAVFGAGLELFFTRLQGGTPVIYTAFRPDTASAFGPAHAIQAITGFAEAPALSSDGKSLYYHALVNGQFVLYRVTRP